MLLFRWSEDAVATKLKPAFEELLSIRGIEVPPWDAKEKRYLFPNGSKVYMFGLKAVSAVEMMNKIRGLGVNRAGGDQVEEMQPSVAGELRGRLRPNLTATMHRTSFPFQLTFVSNSEDDDFWLSKEFPVDNRIKGRKVFQLSIFDNKHLPQESIDSLLRQYPEDHPKHRTMVLGRRGPKSEGVPVFEGLYRKDLHWRPITIQPDLPILEAFECGKHNPVWVLGQAQRSGGLNILGGIIGLGMVLEDFLMLVQHYRRDFVPAGAVVRTCASPMASAGKSSGYSLTDVLRRKLGTSPIIHPEGNSPIVRIAIIENIASYLRRRNANGDESFGVHNEEEKFIIATRDSSRFSPFVHHAFEGGYTWDDHCVSVGNKEVHHPREDDKFANIMHAIESLELNFCAGRDTPAQKEAKERKAMAAPSMATSGGRSNGWMA